MPTSRPRSRAPAAAVPARRPPVPAAAAAPAVRSPARQLRQRLGDQGTHAAVVRAAQAQRTGGAAPPAAPPQRAPAAPRQPDRAPGQEASAAAPAPSASAALAPVVAALHARAGSARRVTPPAAAVASAQAAAISPGIEQRRGAAAQTVADLDGAKADEVKRGAFKAALKQAIDAATPQPRTEDEAGKVIKTGASQASAAMRGAMGSERDAAAGPLKSAAGSEASPAAQPAPPQAALKTDQAGAPPAPVSGAPVVPQALPAERLDYASDRAPTEQLMAQNGVTPAQLEKGKDPAFGPALGARRGAQQHEAAVAGKYRQSEAKAQDQARASAQQAIGAGLAAVHGARAQGVGKLAGRQLGTMARDAAERKRITDAVQGIKDQTRTEVEAILSSMESEAATLFEAGLARAEQAYAATFEDTKGGVGTWLTTWGSDWEQLIASALATARSAYLQRVDVAIGQVADAVDAKLKAAKRRVADGLKQVETFVQGLGASMRQFGQEALEAVAADFTAMSGDIDQRRDSLVDKLAQQYKASSERMDALEQQLRDANKTLWQRVYDATVGLVKQILAFKDMLLGLLSKAASVIDDIIADPIGFLKNLVSALMLGLKNFVANIGAHLKRGLLGWLFGALGGAGLKLPDTLDLQGIVSIVLQVLGLTYENFRARAVKIVGEPVVAGLEQAAEVFKVLITEGVSGLWRFIKDKVRDLKSLVLDAIMDFVKERVIVAGITWIIGLLNPAAAFFKACKAIYDIVNFFVTRGAQIIELINAVVDSIGAIAKGSLGAAAQWIENALGKAVPVAIGFLAGLLGLGDISGTVRKTIDKAQAPVNKAMDWVIGQAVRLVKGAGKILGGVLGRNKQAPKATAGTPEQISHDLQVEAGLHAIDLAEERTSPDERPSKEDAEKIAADVKLANPIFKSITVEDGGDHWDYLYVASRGKKRGKPVAPRIARIISRLEALPVTGIDRLVVMLRATRGRVLEGYVFHAERVFYWTAQSGVRVIAVELPFSFTAKAGVENSQFDIVLLYDELGATASSKDLAVFIDTKNWSRANELDQILSDRTTPKARRVRAMRELEMWADRMDKRLKKYRRAGVSVRIEWKGPVPARIKEFERTRSSKVYGSIEIVSI